MAENQNIDLSHISFFKRQRYRLEAYLIKILSKIVCSLNWNILPIIAKIIAHLVFLSSRHRRKVALSNLESAFGDKYSPKERKDIAKKSCVIFFQSILELFWSPNFTESFIKKFLIIDESQITLINLLSEVKSGIFCSIHAGNFELIGQYCGLYFNDLFSIAQNFKNPLLEPLFKSLRNNCGQKIISSDGALFRTLRHLKKGGSIGVLVDLNIPPSKDAVIIRCFGKFLMPITKMPAELSLRTGTSIIPACCIPNLGSRGYTIRLFKPIHSDKEKTAQEITQNYWNILEENIILRPEIWIWSHKHWRYRPMGDDGNMYPFYANTYPAYEACIQQIKKNGI